MIDDYKSALACAVGVVGALLVLSSVAWGGVLFIGLLLVGFWRPMSNLTSILLDEAEAALRVRRANREVRELERTALIVTPGGASLPELLKEKPSRNLAG